MDIADFIQIIAILLECAVVVIAVLIATQKMRMYGWFIAATFVLFVLFDLIRIFFPYGLSRLHSLILFVACVSMLYAMWLMYKDARKSG
ncbi:MAG: hypothetical protein ABSG28_05820 [Methanoregula sp.]|jgi:hypothetical protein|uniref:hypothetical protein n=1 Tax=Methanoregula sp. TaxID=2052170 RepID=UPI003C263FCF